ncbi:hypothetical protein VE02_09196 [Pseudogymnoascus sp. 03VT05]|nr:hypothetical protein VE02_09196 [Pseudogymnoascus sp. 03VT05]
MLSVAAYAHSPTNITILAMISVKNSSHEDYFENMMLLRLANDQRFTSIFQLVGGPYPVPTGKEIVTAVKIKLRYYLPRTLYGILFFDGQRARELVGKLDYKSGPRILMCSILSQARDMVENALIFALDKGMLSAGLITPHEVLRRRAKSLTDNAIRDSFTPVVQELLDSALKNHNVTIDFALLSLPDYFPKKHEYIPLNACMSLGIKTVHTVIPKPVAGLKSVATKPDARILLLDHGHHHMGLHAAHRRGRFFLPLDSFAGEVLEKNLFVRVTSKGVLNDQWDLKDKFHIEREGWKLHKEIERARILIKDNIFDCIGKDREDQEDCGEDRHHDEWPLNLKNWWTIIEDFGPSSIPPVVLKWEDVQVTEDDYVKNLSNNIETFLIAARKVLLDNENGESNDYGPPQIIDTVVIVTDQPHGPLLRRAAKLAVGDGVRIYGGRITDFSMAAEGMANLALKRRRHWDNVQDYEEGLTLVPPVCDAHI